MSGFRKILRIALTAFLFSCSDFPRIAEIDKPCSSALAESSYETVDIDTLTWMAKNLNYCIEDSKCYGNDDNNCEKYGRLYPWDAAKSVCSLAGVGWRLPTDDEWKLFEGSFSTGGYYGNSGGSDGFYEAGKTGYWWTSTEKDDYNAYLYEIDKDGKTLLYSRKYFLYSVLCVKNNNKETTL